MFCVGAGVTGGRGNLDLALLFRCESCSSSTVVITNHYSVLLVETSGEAAGLVMEQLGFFFGAASVVVSLRKG